MIDMARGKVRVIKTIEKAFTAFTERNIEYVSFSQLKDWINYNTKEYPSPRLASFLKKQPRLYGGENAARWLKRHSTSGHSVRLKRTSGPQWLGKG